MAWKFAGSFNNFIAAKNLCFFEQKKIVASIFLIDMDTIPVIKEKLATNTNILKPNQDYF